MSRLYTYVVRVDSGLAPNPFWDWCTLALCTPNHQGSAVKAGDWIAGFYDKSHGHKFLYAMEVSERIHMDTYFRDKRFRNKRPKSTSETMQRCGDNFYSLNPVGTWKQHPTHAHQGPKFLQQDTTNPWVFAATRFWYLGRNACAVPVFASVLAGGRGARVNHPADVADRFKEWVQGSFKKGIHALPRDFDLNSADACRACGPNRSLQTTADGCR